ncbi:hypothetical protein BV20DRAFT_1122634 [Pilatotrama ljubarskyi]|nr:hypothetical protein BV20DRAFT_1122634 [Pilatotrama ljubarskyi]
MASFIAAATHFFSRDAWSPSSRGTPDLNDKYEPRPDTRKCLKYEAQSMNGSDLSTAVSRTLARMDRAVPSWSSASAPGGSIEYSRDASTVAGMLSSPGFNWTDCIEESSIFCSSDCDHSTCSPPRLVYSPASSSSIALCSSLPTTPLSPGTPAAADLTLLSPTGRHLSGDKPLPCLPEISKTASTIAERRGAKALALQGTPSPALSPKPRLLSPRTPDSASSFAQRLVGFIRPSTPDSGSPTTPREYLEDPFGGASPSFFEGPYLFDAAPIQPHPDLYDFSVYADDSYIARAPWPAKTRAEHAKTRLYVGVSDFQPDSDSPVSHPSSQAHPAPSPDRPAHKPTPAPTPITLLSPSAPSRSPPAVALPAPPLSRSATLPSSVLPHLRPLLLPQKFARREIADAQSSSILRHTSVRLRPLILPQELARRASYPPRRSRPHRTSFSSSHKHYRALGAGVIPEAMSTADTTRNGHVATLEASKQDRRQSQQLEDLICLLDQSGVLEDVHEADERADVASSDSDDSAGVATPPSLVSRPDSSSPFSLISKSQEDCPEEASAKPHRESRNLEDILELLEKQQEDASVAGHATEEGAAEEEATEGSLCAYAM